MEVMTIDGKVTYGSDLNSQKAVSEGDLVPPGYLFVVAENSYVDIAFDPEWQNIVRITGPASAKIRSAYPTDIKLEYGSIFSRLPKLPKHSTHEIQTPIAIAAVRGSAYLVNHRIKTEVFNFSHSPVFSFSLDSDGDLYGNPLIVPDNHTTEIEKLELPPHGLRVMTEAELKIGIEIKRSIENNVENIKNSRNAKTENLKNVQTIYMQELKERLNKKLKKSNVKLNQADYQTLFEQDQAAKRNLEDLTNSIGFVTSTGSTSGTGTTTGDTFGTTVGNTVGTRGSTGTIGSASAAGTTDTTGTIGGTSAGSTVAGDPNSSGSTQSLNGSSGGIGGASGGPDG